MLTMLTALMILFFVDTSLIFGVKSGVQDCQIITTSIMNAFIKHRPDLFVLNGRVCLVVYIDDQLLAHNTKIGNIQQKQYMISHYDSWRIPHDG